MINLNYERNIQMIAGTYGEKEQLVKTAEETAELTQAALKRRADLSDNDTSAETLRASREALIGEIADVLIMCEQLIYLEGCEGDVLRMIDEKLTRQIERIRANRRKAVTAAQ